jgi:hypothetical protein
MCPPAQELWLLASLMHAHYDAQVMPVENALLIRGMRDAQAGGTFLKNKL